MSTIGVKGIGTTLPAEPLPAAEFAAMQGTTEANVERVIGTTRIYVSDEWAEDFAARAAKKCLENAGVPADAVDVVIWCNTSKRRAQYATASYVQDKIGALNAFSMDLGQNCSDSLTALRTARALIAEDAGVRTVLIVSGEQWAEYAPKRTVEPLTNNYPNVLSDGGAAALVTASERAVLAGFGFATLGKYWDLFQTRYEIVDGQAYERPYFKPDFPDERQLAMDLTRLFRLALERCLKSAAISREQIDHVVFPFSGPPMQTAFARALGLPADKIVRAPEGPTHIGAPDMLHGLEMLYRSGRAEPGQHVLLAARSIGIMRFGLIRL